MSDPDPTVRYCSRGHANPISSQFCSTCGERLAFGPSSAAAPPQTSPGAAPPPAAPPRSATTDPASASALAASPVAGPAHRRPVALPVIVGVALLVVAIAAGAIAVLGAVSKPTLRGIAVLYDFEAITGSWNDCHGTGGYSDFSAGMRLSIRGRNDEIVGSGTVRNVSRELIPTLVEMDWQTDGFIGLDERNDREAAEQELLEMLTDNEDVACTLYFEAELEDSDYYAIELSDRGALEYSKADLEQRDYNVSLTLGP